MQKFWGLKGDQIKHLKEKIWTIEMSKLQQCWYYSKLDILWIFIKASRVLLKIDNTCLNRFHAKFSWPFYLAGITNWMSTGQIQTSNAFCLTHTMLKKWLRDFLKKKFIPTDIYQVPSCPFSSASNTWNASDEKAHKACSHETHGQD